MAAFLVGVTICFFVCRFARNGLFKKALAEAEIIKKNKIVEAKEKFIALKAEHENMVHQQEQIKQQDEELFSLRTQVKQAQADLRNLQIAHALTVDSPQRQKAKNHIRSIIADIDRTIETLKH